MEKITIDKIKSLEDAQEELINKTDNIIIEDYFKSYKLSNYFKNDKNILIRIKIKSLYQNQSDIRELIKNLKKENIKINDRLIKRYE